MGRMHSKGKGISGSSLPFKRTAPSWVKTSADEVSSHYTRAVAEDAPVSSPHPLLGSPLGTGRPSRGHPSVAGQHGGEISRPHVLFGAYYCPGPRKTPIRVPARETELFVSLERACFGPVARLRWEDAISSQQWFLLTRIRRV